jgi:hypothetical protein
VVGSTGETFMGEVECANNVSGSSPESGELLTVFGVVIPQAVLGYLLILSPLVLPDDGLLGVVNHFPLLSEFCFSEARTMASHCFKLIYEIKFE